MERWNGLLVGLYVGIFLVIVQRIPPQPEVTVAAMGLLALYLAVAAAVVWVRTRLPLATASIVVGSVFFLVVAALEWSYGSPWTSTPWSAVPLAAVLSAPLLLVAESRRNPESWSRWREHGKGVTILGFLGFRHIPDLRDSESSS